MSRWDMTERPILQAVFAMETEQRRPGNLDKRRIAQVANVSYDQLTQSLGYLAADRLINVIDASGSDGPDYLVEGVTPEGLRAIGEWPTDERLAAVMPSVLYELAEQSDDNNEASVYRNAATLLERTPTTSIATLIKSLTSLETAL